MRLGQTHMMEYILLVVFIIILMVAFMILMTVFHIGGIKSEQSENVYKQSISITRFILNAPYFNNPNYDDGSVLDDSKLTVANCTELRKVLGRNWFALVKIPPDGGPEILCNISNYPQCNSWVICNKTNVRIGTCIHEIPVNIFRKMSNDVNIGILVVGLYGKCT